MIKYCSYIKIFCEGITIIVPWVKEPKSKSPMSIYYACYIHYKFFFFYPGYYVNHFRAQYFYTSIIFDHILFSGRFNFLIFQITMNFGVYVVHSTHVPKIHRAALLPFA
jgi:hypothetical protein